jgi:CRISPR-associated protein Cmr5
MKTRAQQDMELAARLVQEVKSRQSKETAQIYGGLCHSFPVLVRTCGLCQALAFSKAKAGEEKDPREEAHSLLLQHVQKVLGIPGDLLQSVREASASDYMLYTRRVLSAWVYFKRFAESIIGVSAPEQGVKEAV